MGGTASWDRAAGPVTLLRRRETGTCGGAGSFSAGQRCHLTGRVGRPTRPSRLLDHAASRAYIGQFSADGSRFIAAYQAIQRVRVYNSDCNFELMKDVWARNLHWTITDITISPDQRFLLYATISQYANLVSLSDGDVYSEANVTDVHDTLNFGREMEGEYFSSDAFGIWSMRWSGNGREVVVGTNAPSLVLFDVEARRATANVQQHEDDVNAVAYADPLDPNIIVSGSDDTTIKVWDRRKMGSTRRGGVVGDLLGHTEGITYLDAKGDGRYILSNSKDQTAKLWDLRKMGRPSTPKRLAGIDFRWDYRGQEYPGSGYDIRHPDDVSLQTFRGHKVLKTLIRAYFSPAFSTGSQFVYAGSADGSVYIWDVVKGVLVDKLLYHKGPVRDVHWHPFLPLLVSSGFDGNLLAWTPRTCGAIAAGEEEAGDTALIRSAGDRWVY